MTPNLTFEPELFHLKNCNLEGGCQVGGDANTPPRSYHLEIMHQTQTQAQVELPLSIYSFHSPIFHYFLLVRAAVHGPEKQIPSK